MFKISCKSCESEVFTENDPRFGYMPRICKHQGDIGAFFEIKDMDKFISNLAFGILCGIVFITGGIVLLIWG